MRPKVSIIMPSLNVADYIEECIESALHQTLQNIEIICIDAGSTDGTWEILQKYAEKFDPKVRLIHSEMKSYGYQVNAGIKESKGEYVAILETDDYADPNMYEALYKLAFANDADVVKADYDSFITLENGSRYFKRVKLWEKETENYNRILCPGKNVFLYANDYNIWKGIYRKAFLVDNHIRLNESVGAAYQDIGFSEQVLACAQRAYYSDESFYRYRMDRETSSVNSVNGLKYSFQEFKRLLEDTEFENRVVCKEGLYYHMAQSFYCEYRKTLIAVKYNVESEHLATYYNWFRQALLNAWKKNYLPFELMNEIFVEAFKLLLQNPYEFATNTREIEQNKKRNQEKLLKAVLDKKIFIFGAGQRGNTVIDTLRKAGIEPELLCDNNEKIWGSEVAGLKVQTPKKCVAESFACDSVFVVANKLHGNDIADQLKAMGVSTSRIVVV